MKGMCAHEVRRRQVRWRTHRTLTVTLDIRPWWHRAKYQVKFCVSPHGWFRGRGATPEVALRRAWRQARRDLPLPALAEIGLGRFNL
jgi:hypothetical protein